MKNEKVHYIYYACGAYGTNTTDIMNKVTCKRCGKFVAQMLRDKEVWEYYKREKGKQ